MSYKKMYARRGMSARSRLLMELDAERSLEEDIADNVLRSAINFEGIEMPLKAREQLSTNANASPSPGSNLTVKRIRLVGKLNIYPDESECSSPDAKSIRSDMDSFYFSAVDTEEVSLSKPGTKHQLQPFGRGPADGKKQHLRFLDDYEADPEFGVSIMAERGGS